MTQRTKNTVAKVKRMLKKAVDLHCIACGREEGLLRALDAEIKLVQFVREELERTEVGGDR